MGYEGKVRGKDLLISGEELNKVLHLPDRYSTAAP